MRKVKGKTAREMVVVNPLGLSTRVFCDGFSLPLDVGLEVGGYKCQNKPSIDLHPLPAGSGPGHSHGNKATFMDDIFSWNYMEEKAEFEVTVLK